MVQFTFGIQLCFQILKCLLSNKLILALISLLEIQMQLCFFLWTFGAGATTTGEKPCQIVHWLPSAPISQFVSSKKSGQKLKELHCRNFWDPKDSVIMTAIENSNMLAIYIDYLYNQYEVWIIISLLVRRLWLQAEMEVHSQGSSKVGFFTHGLSIQIHHVVC